MTSWFNPRVAAVAISIVLLVQVSKLDNVDSAEAIQKGCITCAAMLVLYGLAFLIPISRTLGFKRIVWAGICLFGAWLSVALAIVADAMPRTLAERMENRFNWPMAAACVAGTVCFTLFFQDVSRSLRLREDILEATNDRDE